MFCLATNTLSMKWFTSVYRQASKAKNISQTNLLCLIDNDPSAGSPTETLLRLLLPLNDQV